jgi:hypothetical protein
MGSGPFRDQREPATHSRSAAAGGQRLCWWPAVRRAKERAFGVEVGKLMVANIAGLQFPAPLAPQITNAIPRAEPPVLLP